MVKVKLSQIKEENSKPVFSSSKTKTKKKLNYEPLDDYEYYGEDVEEAEEDKKVRLKKLMLYFKDEGITITAWDLNTIETDTRFVEKPKAHWEYGIVINKGLAPSQFVNRTDLYIWFMNEEFRDRKYEKMLEVLKENGLNVIEL